MSDLMAGFKKLLDSADPCGMDELCVRFKGFYQYANILETIAAEIESGEIEVPR